MSVSIRRVENDYHETGSTPGTRTDVEYQLGGEIDGVFVPFVTVASGRVEMFQAQDEARKKAEKSKNKSSTDSGDSE